MLLGLYVKEATQQIKKATAFLKSHEELVPSSEDYWLAAEINAALRRAGRPIGDADPLIAACAINRDMVLATGNTRHYQFVIDVGFEHIAVEEARRLMIPVIGIVDTNNDPDKIDYVIPGNDDSLRAVNIYLSCVADAIENGSQSTGRNSGSAEYVEVV